jgi:hypothetical protein
MPWVIGGSREHAQSAGNCTPDWQAYGSLMVDDGQLGMRHCFQEPLMQLQTMLLPEQLLPPLQAPPG